MVTTQPVLQRVIVGLGDVGGVRKFARQNIGFQITTRLLMQCRVSPVDVHDPSRGASRSSSRQKNGTDRVDVVVWGRERKPSHQVKVTTWDTPAFCDFGGVWCDRLLLGEPPLRCAVLQPHTTMRYSGESLVLVLRAFGHLDVCDFLIVAPSSVLPLGRQQIIGLRNAHTLVNALTVQNITSQLSLECEPSALSSTSVLCVGINGATKEDENFSALEQKMVNNIVVPFCTYLAALWVTNPARAVELALVKDPLLFTSQRQWATLQSSMLSSRDSAVLSAYQQGIPIGDAYDWSRTQREAFKILENCGVYSAEDSTPKK